MITLLLILLFQTQGEENLCARGHQFDVNGVRRIAYYQIIRYEDSIWLIIKDDEKPINERLQLEAIVEKETNQMYIYSKGKTLVLFVFRSDFIIMSTKGVEVRFHYEWQRERLN